VRDMDLVTGATGHIGNVLVRSLLEKGRKVRALVLPGEDMAPLHGLEVEVIAGDVLREDSLTPAFADIDVVFHLAGMISILPGRDELVERVNVLGTQNCLRAALGAGVQRFVYTSSIHAINRLPHGQMIDERLPFDPVDAISAYDRSKAVASLAVLASVCQGLDAVIACPTGVIGPYDYRLSEMGSLILDCIEKKPQLYVDGAYDFVDVRDVAEGLLQVGESGRTGESYILSGEQISVRSILETVLETTGERFAMLRIPLRLARFASAFTPVYYRLRHMQPRFTSYSLATLQSNCAISHAKASRELGYTPRRLRLSLADTVAWLIVNRLRGRKLQKIATAS
jgi:dihydroflavonol-4-reductase